MHILVGNHFHKEDDDHHVLHLLLVVAHSAHVAVLAVHHQHGVLLPVADDAALAGHEETKLSGPVVFVAKLILLTRS